MIRKLSALFLALLLTLTAIPALAEDYSPTSADLIGTWAAAFSVVNGRRIPLPQGNEVHMIYRPDGTGEMRAYSNGVLATTSAFTYVQNGAYITNTAVNSYVPPHSTLQADGVLTFGIESGAGDPATTVLTRLQPAAAPETFSGSWQVILCTGKGMAADPAASTITFQNTLVRYDTTYPCTYAGDACIISGFFPTGDATVTINESGLMTIVDPSHEYCLCLVKGY